LHKYEFERRAFAQELIAFDKWYAAGFSAAETAKPQESISADLSGPFASVSTTLCSPTALMESNRAYRSFIGMLSGCDIRYEPSDIVVDPQAGSETKVVVGMRLPPCALIRTADRAPVDIQDTCPSDGRFKVLIFGGNFVGDADMARWQSIGERLRAALEDKITQGLVGIVNVLKTVGEERGYQDLPITLRMHWAR
jgi:phenol 2-monooxygenase